MKAKEKISSLNNYIFQKKLGSGSYGNVTLVKCCKTKQLLVLKEYKINNDYDKEIMRNTFFDEINVLKALNHPNIIKLFKGFKLETGQYYILLEYAESNISI